MLSNTLAFVDETDFLKVFCFKNEIKLYKIENRRIFQDVKLRRGKAH